NRSRNAREAFTRVLDLSAHRDALRRQLEQADHQLRSTRPELYAEYDRVRAEGEFRTGVALPLAALIAVAAYKWHLEFNIRSETTVFYTVVGVPAFVWIVIGRAGKEQTNNAKRMLYAAIREKTVILTQQAKVGETIFVYKPLPEINRPAVIRYAV